MLVLVVIIGVIVFGFGAFWNFGGGRSRFIDWSRSSAQARAARRRNER